MSDITKSYNAKSKITFFLSLSLNIIPMLIFVIIGFCQGDVTQKVAIGFTAIAALVLGTIMLLSKAKLGRSLFWIIFLVMYVFMTNLYPIIIAMGICTIIDDLIVSPLHSRWNTDYHTNKQIDKRENINGTEIQANS